MRLYRLPIVTLALSSFLLPACKTLRNDLSQLNNNGRESTTDENPQTLRLYDTKKTSTCTAQLIDTDLILTAAHCAQTFQMFSTAVYKEGNEVEYSHTFYSLDETPTESEVYFKGTKIGTTGEIILHPDRALWLKKFAEKIKNTEGQYGKGKFGGLEGIVISFEQELTAIEGANKVNDLALIKLKRLPEHAQTEIPLVKLSPVPAVVGQVVLIVGFGGQVFAGSIDGKKRQGENTIAKVLPTHYEVSAPADSQDPMHTIAYQGDSGGMLYDKNTGMGLGIVSFVNQVSSIGDESKDQVISTSHFVNLHNAGAAAFLCGHIPKICKENPKPAPTLPAPPKTEVPAPPAGKEPSPQPAPLPEPLPIEEPSQNKGSPHQSK